MDSFYDQPRKAPMPKILSTTTENLLPNLVPDVSMLTLNKGNIPQKRNEMSYNAWKYQLRGEQPTRFSNKENSEPSHRAQLYSTTHQQPTGSIFRKQVRFETVQQSQPGRIIPEKLPNFNIMPVRPALVNANRPTFNLQETRMNEIKETDRFAMPRKENRNILPAKPFEKLYMANVPNRNLDLSLIEAPRCCQRSQSAPKVIGSTNYHNLDRNTYNDRQYCIDNSNREILHNENRRTIETKHLESARCPIPESTIEIMKLQSEDNDEPSVKDLLKIIHQQNQQLMCLQQQVSTLFKDRSEKPQIEAPAAVFANKNALDTKSALPLQNKFAIDVMTSFEVSIRAPNRFNNRRFSNNEAVITEISDSNILDDSKTSSKQPTDLSLKLDEPLVVPERCQSPENSIHVDMQDFSSDEEDEEDTTDCDLASSMMGWTIYNNVMDQVNFMLKKSTSKDANKPRHREFQDTNGEYTGAIMKQVKEATMKHLKNAGINLKNIDEDITISSTCAYTPNQVSFAVKQLLMKYLPDEQLSKVAMTRQSKTPPLLTHGDYPKNVIKRRPEFSMATVQYMEKYNLLNRDGLVDVGQSPEMKKLNAGNKMLDITALKQQPKLV